MNNLKVSHYNFYSSFLRKRSQRNIILYFTEVNVIIFCSTFDRHKNVSKYFLVCFVLFPKSLSLGACDQGAQSFRLYYCTLMCIYACSPHNGYQCPALCESPTLSTERHLAVHTHTQTFFFQDGQFNFASSE